MNKRSECFVQYAFTLAEILITLVIIGIVAAMTITQIINELQDMQFKEAAKVAYSRASQVVKLMKTDTGGWNENILCDDFAYHFSSYFKTIDSYDLTKWGYGMVNRYAKIAGGTCPNNIYRTLSHQSEYGRTCEMYFQFQTLDGMFWSTDYWDNTSPTYKFIITVDVNGYQNNPNTFGKDVFMFQIVNGSLLPMGADATIWNLINPTNISHNCTRGGATWSTQGLSCMYYVMHGINY